jgi:protein-disulfide isomerase
MAETPEGEPVSQPTSKNSARREAARRKAQEIQQQEQRRRRRRRLLTQLSIVLGLLIVAALVVGLVNVLSRPSGKAPANMASGGILLGKGLKAERTSAPAVNADPVFKENGTEERPLVQVYLDYMCPFCGQFEQQNTDFLRTQVADGSAQLQIHPVAALDAASTTNYSTRAANAAAAVATYAPDSFFDFNTLMFTNQPEEQSAGLTDARIGDLAEQAVKKTGGSAAAVKNIRAAIKSQRFKGWVAEQTTWAQNHKVPGSNKSKPPLQIGTPVVYVNGKYWTNDFSGSKALSFTTFFTKVASGDSSAAAVSPSPSASPSS